MNATRSWWTNGLSKSHVSNRVIEPKPAYLPGEQYNISESAVAWERLCYSFRVLIFGKTATDARIKRKGIRRPS
jgi:hypothetical protein